MSNRECLKISTVNQTEEKINFNQIIKELQSILRRLKMTDRLELELVIVEEKKIIELNTQYRHVKEPTDVLSFPLVNKTQSLIGSIVISLDSANKQAQKAGTNLAEELKRLATHGFLHLLGFHHQ